MSRLRRRAPRRRRPHGERRARDAASPGPDGEGARPPEAEVDRRLAAANRALGARAGDRARGGRRRPRPLAGAALLAGRPGAVHHAPRRDHTRPALGRPQRRHVPDAGDRRPHDVHALADPQGRARRLARDRRPDPRRRRARARPGDGLLRERAAAEAHRRAHARRLPARCPGRARQGRDRRPRGAGARRDRPRGLHRQGRARRGGPVRRPHRLLHRRRSRSPSSTSPP